MAKDVAVARASQSLSMQANMVVGEITVPWTTPTDWNFSNWAGVAFAMVDGDQITVLVGRMWPNTTNVRSMPMHGRVSGYALI